MMLKHVLTSLKETIKAGTERWLKNRPAANARPVRRNRHPLAQRLRVAARIIRLGNRRPLTLGRILKNVNRASLRQSLQLGRSPLSRKLIGLMAGLIAVSVGLTGFLAYDAAEKSIRTITQQRLQSEADKMTEKITILRLVAQDGQEFDRALRKELERQQSTLALDGLTVSELFVTADGQLAPFKGRQETLLPVPAARLQAVFEQERGVAKLDVAGEPYTAAYAKAAELNRVYMLFVRDAEYLAPVQRLRDFVVGAIVSATLAACLIALVIVHGIAKPIEYILAAIREVSRGDYTHKITLRISRRSEMGALITHFNTMVDDVSDVMTRIKRIIGELARVGGDMSQQAGQTAQNAEVLKQRALAVAADARRIRQTTDEADRSFADMKQATGAVVERFAGVRTKSGELHASAEQGRCSIETLLGVMRGHVEEAQQMKGLMGKLLVQSKEIEQVLGMIRTLAAETKLVSLNATIEAARAGAAGRSFAVVAQEVQRLAEQSNHAADDIRHIVRDIQVQTLAATDVVGSMADRIADSASLTENAEAAFQSLLAGVADSSAGVVAMAGRIDQLAAEIGALEAGIGTIADIALVTDENSRAMVAAAQEQATAAAASQVLAEQTGALAARLGSLTARLQVAEQGAEPVMPDAPSTQVA